MSINCNEIEEHVYLGDKNAAHSMDFLVNYNIKRVLTLRQFAIKMNLRKKDIVYKHIEICDNGLEDILSSFDDCFKFINDGQKNGENVLIHCHLGISRSSSVVIAFMMKKYSHSRDMSLQSVRLKRVCSQPNTGFNQQLLLWQKMSYKLIGDNHEYRQFLFKSLRHQIEIKVYKLFSGQNFELCFKNYKKAFEKYFRRLAEAESNVKSLERGYVYNCKCGTDLFNEMHVLKHDSTSLVSNDIHIEPQQWIFDSIVLNAKTIADLLRGDINCYFCQQYLGSFEWEFDINI